jgi:hypothetical protein
MPFLNDLLGVQDVTVNGVGPHVPRARLNIICDGASVADNRVTEATDLTIPSGGEGGGGDGDGGTATALATTGAPVDVSGSAPPTAGQLPIATDEEHAEWTDPKWLELATYNAGNTIVVGVDGDGGVTPVALAVPASRIVARLATGDIVPATAAEILTLLGPVGGTDSTARAAAAAAQATADAAVPKALFDANTVLAATTDDTPAAITMAPSTMLVRLASGNIKAGTVAELQALLSISVSGGGAITQFSWASNAATLSLLTSKNWAPTNTLTGNSTLTITNGVEGDYGTIYVKQDGTGGRTLTFTISGRTIIRDTNSIDDNPQSTNGAITAYNYQFVTINGATCIRLTKVFLA